MIKVVRGGIYKQCYGSCLASVCFYMNHHATDRLKFYPILPTLKAGAGAADTIQRANGQNSSRKLVGAASGAGTWNSSAGTTSVECPQAAQQL